MWRLLCITAVLSVARYAECGESSGFQRIKDYIPADWGDSDSLSDDDLKSRGTFTVWINTDDSKIGTGDFENVKAILNRQKNNPDKTSSCDLYCSQPVAVEWKLVDSTHEADIDQCLVLFPERFGEVQTTTYPGYNCLDAYQNDPSKSDFCTREKCIEIGMRKPGSRKRDITCDQCPDMKVRYLCPEAKPADSCPSASSSKRTIENSIDGQLEQLNNEIEAHEKELADLKTRANELEEHEMRKREMDDDDKISKLKSLLKQLEGF